MANVNDYFDGVGRGYYFYSKLDDPGRSSGKPVNGNHEDEEGRQPASKDVANLISSKSIDGNHYPVLDFDVPARYVPSTTPGHGHLYIDVPMTWEKYERLLLAMAYAGILEEGYVQAALRRKATYVRPEWVKKKNERGY